MKLASIELIKEIVPHPNADRLELAKVLGWQCVVEKGKFYLGQAIVFVFTDTILPRTEWSEFLVDKDNPEKPIRLRTIKLRGEYSSGLILPIHVLPAASQSWHEGADVGGELGIKKYEKEIPSQLSGERAGLFPGHLASRTDEDNGLSNPDLVRHVLNGAIEVTRKLDGSSMTVCIEEGKITHVCSRNMALVESDKNAFWIAAKKLTIPEYFTGVVQGELMGPGIQGNQLKLSEPEIYVFQIRTRFGNYLSYQDTVHTAKNMFGAKYVPEALEPEFRNYELEELQEIADAQKLPCGAHAEGIVVRPSDARSHGSGRPLGFKLINRNYKDL